MNLNGKMKKRLLSLGLALSVTAASVPVWQMPMQVRAAEAAQEAAQRANALTLETVREEARQIYNSSKMALDLDLSKETFDGTKYKDYSGNKDIMSVLNNLKDSDDDQTVIIRFKPNQDSGLLYGAGPDTDTDAGKNMTLALNTGRIRPVFRNYNYTSKTAKAGLKGNLGSGFSTGQWHILAMSFEPSKSPAADNVRIVVDSGNELYAEFNWGNIWGKAGFNQGDNTEYKVFQVGGGDYVGVNNNDYASANFNGQIDSLTIINKAYSTAELQKITTDTTANESDKKLTAMYETGTAKTWLFTGGTEVVADFKTSKTTRNWVGLFEEKFRDSSTLPQALNYIDRGRFVFNTGRRGADVAYILEHYKEMIEDIHTEAVGILIGEADYSKGTTGLDAFQTSLSSLVDRINEEGKLAIVVTPYQKDSNAASYTEAVNDAVGETAKVVDLSGAVSESNISADGVLTASGHQEIANVLKRTLGASNKVTNNSFGSTVESKYLMDAGAYTIAKSDAEVTVTADTDNSVKVTADTASFAGASAKLSYTLTDTNGQTISGNAKDGAAEFTISGLRPGMTYTLQVTDNSRTDQVAENYRPVKITLSQGSEGVSQEHPDGNISTNSKILDVFNSEEPATWLFMGDSITHGILTQGYDNVPQLFAKYLDEAGRSEDIVLNTGVSNATIATTMAQSETRLTRYQPDVVMIMIGTNDCASSGNQNAVTADGQASNAIISVEEFQNRYENMIKAIHELNTDASVVVRVPCEMRPTSNRTDYKKYFDGLNETWLEKVRADIPGMNITLVNHYTAWNEYKDNVRNDNISSNTYSWLLNDGVHPNGRGNVAMVQQIIRELGLYEPTSELANYAYALSDWTGTSTIAAPVTSRKTEATFAMSALSGYTNKLKEVTLTMTDDDGQSYAKTAEYDENGSITVNGLNALKSYTAAVTGKDAATSKTISFTATVTEGSLALTTEERAELSSKAEEAAVVNTANYGEAQKAEYEAAVKAVQALASKADATVVEMQQAIDRLNAAKAAGEAFAASELKKAMDALTAAVKTEEAFYNAGNKGYTADSWAKYGAALALAKQANETSSVSQLKELLLNLQNAKKGLTPEALTPVDPTPVPGKPAPNGAILKDASGNYNYKVTDSATRTVEITKQLNKKLAKIKISSVVSLNGVNYTVTSIGNNVFKGNKKITAVTGGKNLVKIGKSAFAGCTKLKTVTLSGKKLKEIGASAFSGDKALKKITLKTTALKKAGAKAFKGIHKKAVIKVPKAKLKAYKKTLAKKGQAKTVKIK